MEWLNNLNNAIEYIENNLTGKISVEEAARIACCSPYYFQRMFSYVTGVPLSEYIRRRRMSQAAFELQRTDRKVLDIALEYGYTSPTSFNRAFRSVHGIPPAAARSRGIPLNAYLPVSFSVKITGETPLIYHIEEKSAMRVVGVRTPITGDIEDNQKHIPGFWKDILQKEQFKTICALSDENPARILGISVYQNPDSIYYYIAASTDKKTPAGMYEYEIPAATRVIFENDGPFREHVQTVFRRFFAQWLPFSGYRYAGLPDIEVYPLIPEGPPCGHCEVQIAVTRQKKEE